MRLKELYKHRTDFTIVGLTGRTGSGCTKIAEFLSKDFEYLKKSGVRDSSEFKDHIFKRKFEICLNYLNYENNWEKFTVIDYEKVLFLLVIKEVGLNKNLIKDFLLNVYRQSSTENNELIVENILETIINLFVKNKELIEEVGKLSSLNKIRKIKELKSIFSIFYNKPFTSFYKKFIKILEEESYIKRLNFSHYLSCCYRSSASCLYYTPEKSENIYFIAETINTLIKSKRKDDKEKMRSTKIVIDSLRNSLEIIYFKERFSAFYMIATKDVLSNSEDRIEYRLKNKNFDINNKREIIKEILDLDEIEYRTKDFSSGNFSSPDVENCIQKSDFHIFNLKKGQVKRFLNHFKSVGGLSESEELRFKNSFLTREEQLMKLIALINQPGVVTPSASERNMQVAYTAKLNSGCVSRQVGAVITDQRYLLKSLGWNDVAKGHTPCNLRNVEDFFVDGIESNINYSEFEKGNINSLSTYKYKDLPPFNFKEAIKDYFYEDFSKNKDHLNGKNCSFCFKTVHNFYEGESNQVHTRSLHAEENAMLQLTKYGGLGVNGGILFTTASPCELCSKKAYQLGIRLIYYIDPYPGIAVDQILGGGVNKPLLIPFSGAIGNSYHKLYEPYLSAKDEVTMTLELRNKNTHINQFKSIMKKIYPQMDAESINSIKSIDDVQNIIDYGLGNYKSVNEDEIQS